MAFLPRPSKPDRLTLDLQTAEGNAYYLLAAAQNLGKALKLPDETVKAIQAAMCEQDWRHLVGTFDKHFGQLVDLIVPDDWDLAPDAPLSAPTPTPTPTPTPALEPVHGDLLPPVGSRVFIRHGRDNDAHACLVTGYYAWSALDGNPSHPRLSVRLVYEGTDITNARSLGECWPTAEAALAHTPGAPPRSAPRPRGR
jgi:hypothetical protein